MATADMLPARNGPREIVGAGGEIVSLNDFPMESSAAQVTRAEIDVQIATAKRFPREFPRFMRMAKAMIESDPELAAKCTYRLPPRKNDKGEMTVITGPSVRLAEIVAVCWGNLRVVGRITDDDGKMITATGIAMDLEMNVGYSMDVLAGVTYSPRAKFNPGARFSDDMIKTVSNAAIARATRNATFKVVPMAFVKLLEEHAADVARGDVKSIPQRKSNMIAWFERKGIGEAQVFAGIGITSFDEMTIDHVLILDQYRTAIADGEVSIEEIFAAEKPKAVESSPTQAPPASSAEKLLDRVAPGRKENKPTPKPEAPEPGSGG